MAFVLGDHPRIGPAFASPRSLRGLRSVRVFPSPWDADRLALMGVSTAERRRTPGTPRPESTAGELNSGPRGPWRGARPTLPAPRLCWLGTQSSVQSRGGCLLGGSMCISRGRAWLPESSEQRFAIATHML